MRSEIMMEFKLGELFCGPGGLALGAKETSVCTDSGHFKIEHEWATDYDDDSCQTYRRNICPNQPESVHCDDVRQLNWSKLSPIEALAFGFPCNDFSVVGEHRGVNGSFGPLYTYGVEALNRFQPIFFMAENVGGLRSANGGGAFKTILNELHHAGYAVTPHLYRFEDYGLPQARHRIIIIGIRMDQDVRFRVPAPHQWPSRTSQDAINNPPIATGAANNELTRQSPTVVERLKHIKPGENAFTADLPDHLRLNVKGAKISQIYKRLDSRKPAYTVTGSGGGGTHVYHWSENRALTNRERARLQTFPDDYVFEGSKESVRKQIGMALPPDGAKVIFNAVLNSFAQVDYPSVDPNIAFTPAAQLQGNMKLYP